ncbi:MAG TPA: hypothetical protein VFH43_12175 [Candidatus Kapabacteria bacterium]|nr:hypothetical protein [Candidatus Kapabacteria bacterium]
MKKIALPLILFVTVHVMSCTPRPEDDVPQIGDSLSTTVPIETPQGNAPADREQTDPTRQNYILPVDTSYISIEGGKTLIRVRGPLGDGCQKFEYIDSVKDGSTLKLAFWASRPKDPNTVCTQQFQAYEKEIVVDRTLYDRYIVKVPNGLERAFPITP